jgi:hypothetical protein
VGGLFGYPTEVSLGTKNGRDIWKHKLRKRGTSCTKRASSKIPKLVDMAGEFNVLLTTRITTDFIMTDCYQGANVLDGRKCTYLNLVRRYGEREIAM